MLYPRKIFSSIQDHLAKKQATVITGMRRTGKTTLVHQLLGAVSSPNTLYLDLERVDNRELFAEKNYDAVLVAFRERGLDLSQRAYVALDEIQLAPQAPSVIKYLYDHADIKFILTGSSSYYLKHLFTESLAGRKKVFELFPLDFGEFLTFHTVPHETYGDARAIPLFRQAEYDRLRAWYEMYVAYGGFPEVVLAGSEQDKKDLLADIVSSYINIDVRTLSDIRHHDRLYSLLKLLAASVGSRLDYAKLSRAVGISRATVQDYVDFLEETYIIARVPVHTSNAEREIVKAKKCYFLDTGMLSVLAAVNSGAQFENAVFTQVRQRGDVRYFALKNGREIDFILNEDIALEVKETPDETDVRSLQSLAVAAQIPRHAIVGRHCPAAFREFIWGGDIR